MNKLTPVQSVGGLLFKRDDLYEPFGPGEVNGGKMRQCMMLLDSVKDEITGVISCCSIHSPQAPITAAAALAFGKRCKILYGGTSRAKLLESPMPRLCLKYGAFRKEDKLKALESLGKVGILDKAYMRADQLSGGQQQRVALARTLTQDPHIILADEPVAALDPVTAKQVMEDFVHINQELGISILLNIHHVELALEYADRVIGIRAGRIVYDGPSKQVDQTVLDAIYGEDAVSEAAV